MSISSWNSNKTHRGSRKSSGSEYEVQMTNDMAVRTEGGSTSTNSSKVSERTLYLSLPKKVSPAFLTNRHPQWPVSKSAMKATPSKRVTELAQHKPYKMYKPDYSVWRPPVGDYRITTRVPILSIPKRDHRKEAMTQSLHSDTASRKSKSSYNSQRLETLSLPKSEVEADRPPKSQVWKGPNLKMPYKPSERLHDLAVPKPTYHVSDHKEWRFVKGVCYCPSPRLKELAEPKGVHAEHVPPFKDIQPPSIAARTKAEASDRLIELAQPKQRSSRRVSH